MPPKSSYPDETWLDNQYNNYPPLFGQAAGHRTSGERQSFPIYEDPNCRNDNEETAATPMARSPTDPNPGSDQENANSLPSTNAETITGPQVDTDHPANNNVPETPSTFTTVSLEQMMLASRRQQPVASATENFIRNNNADELDAPTSPSPMNGPALPTDITSAEGGIAGGSGVETLPISSPRMNVGESLILNSAYRLASNETNDRESSDATFPPPPIREGDVGLTTIRNTRAVAFPLTQTSASLIPPTQTPAYRTQPPQSPASRLLRPSGSTSAIIVRSTGTHEHGLTGTPAVRRLFRNSVTNLDSTPAPNHIAWEPQLVLPTTPNAPLRLSRLRSVSFTSAIDEDTEMASPSVTIPECQTGERHVTTPVYQTEERRVTSKTRETLVTTPEYQTGGTPPTPHTPCTLNTWISPSQAIPELVARMFTLPVYRNRDEPMTITPSPPALEPSSPNEREMEDAFWIPNKPRASLNVAGLQKKALADQKPIPMENAASVEKKAPIMNSAPFSDAMAQDFAPIQEAVPIRNPAPVEGAVSPSTKTVRMAILPEITTTIMMTPSPPESPIPARRLTASLRPIAATSRRKTANAPHRQVASTPQRKGKGRAEQMTNRRRTADQIVPGGIKRHQELRTSSRYSLRDSTRGIMPGTYSFIPVRNQSIETKISPGKY